MRGTCFDNQFIAKIDPYFYRYHFCKTGSVTKIFS